MTKALECFERPQITGNWECYWDGRVVKKRRGQVRTFQDVWLAPIENRNARGFWWCTLVCSNRPYHLSLSELVPNLTGDMNKFAKFELGCNYFWRENGVVHVFTKLLPSHLSGLLSACLIFTCLGVLAAAGGCLFWSWFLRLQSKDRKHYPQLNWVHDNVHDSVITITWQCNFVASWSCWDTSCIEKVS